MSSQNELIDNVKIHEPLGNSDHNQIHFDVKLKSESTNKKYRRNFHKGKYKYTRKYLVKLDWNNMPRNKTTTECWNIKTYVTESIIDKFVSLKKQGKRKRKKKETIRNILYRQTMLRVYRHTRTDEDYTNYSTKRHLMQLYMKLDNLKEAE